jgi:EAL domain-containing protein (putative c-di-GMP-specific phosphodiesterase class I)
VIEGIENETHLEIIQDMRADFGQGFYFAKPLSGADAMAFTVEQARQAAGRAPLAVLPTSE